MWHFGYIAAGSLAYVTDGWRQYIVALIILAIPLLSCTLGIVESPSWQIQNGYLDEVSIAYCLADILIVPFTKQIVYFQASKSLTAIAKFNRRKFPVMTPLNLNSIKQQTAAGRQRLGSFDSAQYNPEPTCMEKSLRWPKSIFQFILRKRSLYYVWLLSCLTIAVSASTNAYIFQMSKIPLDPHLMTIIYGAVRLCIMPPVIWLDHVLLTFG